MRYPEVWAGLDTKDQLSGFFCEAGITASLLIDARSEGYCKYALWIGRFLDRSIKTLGTLKLGPSFSVLLQC